MTTSQNSLPPIGVFAHKRSTYLEACLQAIRESELFYKRDLPLYIFCDAPRDDKEKQQVEETIAVAHKYGRGTVVVREKNYGFRNITEGITYLCDKYERAIIIEDDVLISPDFLPFICQALEKYQSDPRVFMASGFMYFGAQPSTPQTFFLNPAFIWGWATWKRAWDHFVWDAPGWNELVKDKKQCYLYDCFGSMPFSKGLRKTMTGLWKAWAPRWMYAMSRANGLTLYPYRSLVWNCGCGGGTHGKASLDADPALGEREYYIHGTMEREEFTKPRLSESVYMGRGFPSEVKMDRRALRYLAITFLRERLRQEKRKRWRLHAKLLFQRCALPFTTRR